ncbi:MAG: hypothetical protein IJH07_00110 [Ruminococcus sp.]|nr:hypothetical protein [Ruminococcus sp.]
MDAKRRRLENNLYTIGTGIIAFGFWSFAKFALNYMLLGSDSYVDPAEEYRTTAIVFIWAFSALSPLVYLWIGLSARAESRGKRKRILYLIMTGIIVAFSVLVIVVDLIALAYSDVGILRVIITMIIDLTRMIFLIELLASSVSLRRLRRRQRKGEEAAA